jgi:hypothetical protein
MKKLQNNQTGVAHLLAIGLIVVFVAVGFIGWKVWDTNKAKSKNTTASTVAPADQKTISDSAKTAQPVDETANWTVFTSAKGWQVSVPDGWNLHTDMSSNGLTDYATLTYKPGTKAVIEKTSAGRGGPFVLNVATYVAGDPATENPAYLTEQTDFKAKNVDGKKILRCFKRRYSHGRLKRRHCLSLCICQERQVCSS